MEEEIMKNRKDRNTKIKKRIAVLPSTYRDLLEDVSVIISNGRQAVVQRINTIHVIVCWLIGRRIVEFYQQGKERASYGGEVLIKLSADLKEKHGKGFSVDNLENMRQFYMEFPVNPLRQIFLRQTYLPYHHIIPEYFLFANRCKFFQ